MLLHGIESVCVCECVCVCVCTCKYVSVFDKLIWCTTGPKSYLYGTAQFSLWASSTVNYDYIITNSINSLLIGSRCIPNGAHTNHCWANLAHASNVSKTLMWLYTWYSNSHTIKEFFVKNQFHKFNYEDQLKYNTLNCQVIP